MPNIGQADAADTVLKILGRLIKGGKELVRDPLLAGGMYVDTDSE